MRREFGGQDFATGKAINIDKAEERVRQNYERTLHYDYGYAIEQMDIEVPIRRGSSKTPERADLVIYKSTRTANRDQFSDILAIMEFKRPDRTDGISQLKTYMSATSAQWGVWTNGEDIEYVFRDAKSGALVEGKLFDVPRQGESLEDIGRLNKADLVPAHKHSLKPIFNRVLKTLYSNTNISRREKLGSEMIRLIFAKIWDERFSQDSIPRFRVGLGEDPEIVKYRVCELFEEIKSELVEDGVFERNETITLDAHSVAWVVGQLERYSLLKTDKDVVGDAFEVFAESKLVGEKGEFFTPREVVRLAVELVNPSAGQSIMDPACGSGGFLIYALEHVWRFMEDDPRYRNSPMLDREKQNIAQRCFFGIDKEIDLVKIAKAYMAIAGDGRGGIAQENTLHAASEFQGTARRLFTEGDDFKQFDIILTNPPFGANIKVLKREAAQFSLGHAWRRLRNGKYVQTNKPRDTPPQILFVERCLDMLKDGGILAMVLPETLFHAPKYRYVLEFALDGNNLQAVIDLPHNTFRPHNNAKTCLMLVQKGVPQQPQILMAVAEEMGHDHLGRPMFRLDADDLPTSLVWDDVAVIRKEIENPYSESNQHTFIIDFSDISEGIFVPRYYYPRFHKVLQRTGDFAPVTIQQLLDESIIVTFPGHGSPEAKYKGIGDIPYIRVSDIVNWELYRNPTATVPRHVFEHIRGNGVRLTQGDVLFVRRGSYRIGSVAMASPFDSDVLLTREFVVFRVAKPDNPYGIDPYYLIYLLSHEYTQKQLSHKVFMDTTLPNIGDRWKELELPLAADPDVRLEVSRQVRGAILEKWQAVTTLNELRTRFGEITT